MKNFYGFFFESKKENYREEEQLKTIQDIQIRKNLTVEGFLNNINIFKAEIKKRLTKIHTTDVQLVNVISYFYTSLSESKEIVKDFLLISGSSDDNLVSFEVMINKYCIFLKKFLQKENFDSFAKSYFSGIDMFIGIVKKCVRELAGHTLHTALYCYIEELQQFSANLVLGLSSINSLNDPWPLKNEVVEDSDSDEESFEAEENIIESPKRSYFSICSIS